MDMLTISLAIAALMVGITEVDADRNKIHFHATLQQTTHYIRQDDERVKMDNVVHNVGGGFCKSSGNFKAPESGYYHFYVQYCTPYETNSGGELWLMHNGKRVLNLVAENPGTARHVQTSGSIIVDCKQGDKLWLQTFRRGIRFRVHGNSFTNFGGYKLF